MVSIASLWLPILVSAILVFFASFLLHMVIPFHRADYRQLPDEDAAMDALRKLAIPPGDYTLPCARSPEAMKSHAFQEKFARGPVVMMTVMKPGPMNLGGSLGQWFLYNVAIGILVAYVTGRAVGPGAESNEVLRFAGVTAFIAYAVGIWQMSIWYKRSWATTLRYTVDGLIYGVLTGVAFQFLWPK
jgi:hypothetical protein